MKPKKRSRDGARRADVSCGDCPTARRCWSDPSPGTHEVTVRREDTLEKGMQPFTQGEPFHGMYLIVSGSVCLTELARDGSERVVGFRVPGELLGLEGWVRGQHPNTARALETTALCRIGWGRDLRQKPSGALLQRLLTKAGAQLERASQAWRGLPATQRVAGFIEDFVRRTPGGESTDKSVTLPMTRAQIGSYLGLAEETVVRALTRLKSFGPHDTERTETHASGSQRRHSAQ